MGNSARNNHRVNLQLADSPRDELSILGTKVENDNRLGGRQMNSPRIGVQRQRSGTEMKASDFLFRHNADEFPRHDDNFDDLQSGEVLDDFLIRERFGANFFLAG